MYLQPPPPIFLSCLLEIDLRSIINTDEQLLDAYPVLNQTFLIKVGHSHSKTYSLIHLSALNKILWKVDFSTKQKYVVIEDSYFLVTNRRENELEIYSLSDRAVTLIEHRFQPSLQTEKMVVNYFHKGKVFCISESTSDQSTLLTYFSYYDLTSSAKAIHQKIVKEVLIHREAQLNDVSKFGWACSSENNCTRFKVFSIKQDAKGKVLQSEHEINVDPSESTQYEEIKFGNGVYKRKLCFSMIRQIKKDEYLLKADELFGTRYFVLDISEGFQKGTIDYLILKYQGHTFDLSDYLLIQSNYHYLVVFKNKTNQTLVFADLMTKQVEEVLKIWDRTESTIIKFIEGRYLMEFYEEQHGKGHITMLDWIVRLKDNYIHLLMGLNRDFDDCLLQDCLDLLC